MFSVTHFSALPENSTEFAGNRWAQPVSTGNTYDWNVFADPVSLPEAEVQ
ncbi:hypothetical protein ACIO8F_31090 [Streptomyces sp. NPDC087228]